jgi:hypothetical protein
MAAGAYLVDQFNCSVETLVDASFSVAGSQTLFNESCVVGELSGAL